MAIELESEINYLSLARKLVKPVREAGQVIMDIYQLGASAKIKDDGSPVTKADLASEAILLHAISVAAPSIQIVSEENVTSHGLSVRERFFLVDPLDGTMEFLKADNKGAFTVNIGLVEGGVPVMGIVYAPAMDRLFFGARDSGAFEMLGNVCRKIEVREPPNDGWTAVASVSHRDEATNEWLQAHGIKNIIGVGSSLKFCLIAAGEADVYPRYGPTMEWDTAAADAILRAAGGRVITADGKMLDYGKLGYRNTSFFAFGSGSLALSQKK
jgi:3'(2'), 5'-bisphosphate nucleotidase